MTIKIIADDKDDIEFEVKGKISLTLTRKGLIYRNELIKDGGEVLRLMTEFLGLAETVVQDELHQAIVQHVKKPQARLEEIKKQKSAMLVIQCSESGEDDSIWKNIFEADVPDWVKEGDVIRDMMAGTKVKANDGGTWYRVLHVTHQVH